MDNQYLGKRVTYLDGGLSGPIILWHPDILLRLRDFCESPGLFEEGEISGGYVRDMLRDARDEIIRLRLTDAEREAVQAAVTYIETPVVPTFLHRHAATLRGLLGRLGTAHGIAPSSTSCAAETRAELGNPRETRQ